MYVAEHTYWAKDIIFLLTEHEEIGMQAWLAAYHDSPTRCELLYFSRWSYQTEYHWVVVPTPPIHINLDFRGNSTPNFIKRSSIENFIGYCNLVKRPGGGALICWTLRVCEADRGIFFTISWMEGEYKNQKSWMEGTLKGPKPEGYQNQAMNGKGSQNFRAAPWMEGGVLFKELRMEGDRGSGGPASHTHTFLDLVTPPPPGSSAIDGIKCISLLSANHWLLGTAWKSYFSKGSIKCCCYLQIWRHHGLLPKFQLKHTFPIDTAILYITFYIILIFA